MTMPGTIRTAVSAFAVMAVGTFPRVSEAQDVPEVLAVEETSEAVFFQPVAQPSIVWYAPRARMRLLVVEPVVSSTPFYRATVSFPRVTASLAELRPEWAGKTLVPYPLRAQSECVLAARPGLRFLQQEVRALGRDAGGGSAAPLCQFAFQLGRDPSLLAELTAAAEAGTLIAYELSLTVPRAREVAWQVVYDAVKVALDGARSRLARALVDEVVDDVFSDLLRSSAEPMTSEAQATFREQVIRQLFIAELSGLRLVRASPPGTVVLYETRTTYAL